MKTITLNTLARGATVMGLLLPITLVAGCGGGGSGPSTPKATPTPTKAPTPTPTPATQAVGTYQGTYSYPTSTGGSFILRVQTNGTATGVFNEGKLDENENDLSISTTGTVNLSSGQISVSGTFDASEQITSDPIPTTVTVSGTANSTGASGTLVKTNSDGTQSGAFTTTKTSTSPVAVPTPTPTPTPAPGALVKRTGKSGLKRGRL